MELTELLWIAQLMACMLVIAGAITSLIELVKALRNHPYSGYRHSAGRNLMIIGTIFYVFMFMMEIIFENAGIM